jgi:DNA-binding transcriptional MerR regulator
MEEDMIMNVPSAPEMQGTPMTPDLSMDMQSEMGDMTQNEIQEAQGALMQILQVINMLIEQGLNPEQIKAFLEQYGISEEELEQAAQALGVDIDMVLSGQMQAPQEPMMMAEGGPSMSDNEPMMQDRSVGNQIFTLQSQINNLMNDYNIAIRDQDFSTAQAIADQINNIDVQITQMQSQMPMGLGEKKN